MIYLASPYTHPDPEVREMRFQRAVQATIYVMQIYGKPVFSPIMQGHELAKYGIPSTWDFWKDVDRKILSVCDELVVLTIPGWQESKGVRAEMQIADDLGIKISFTSGHPIENCPLPCTDSVAVTQNVDGQGLPLDRDGWPAL